MSNPSQFRPTLPKAAILLEKLGRLPQDLWNSRAGYYFLATIFFTALVLIYTWPSALDFDRTLPGYYPTDQDQNIWSLWWMKQALIDLHSNPFQTDYLYYPYGTGLYFHALEPLNGLLVLPWTILAGPIAAYNACALLGLTATAVAGTALGRTVSGSRKAGLVAGYLVAFGPIHFSYINLGQLEFVNLWPFLLYLTFLIRFTDQKYFDNSGRSLLHPSCLLLALLLVLAGAVTLYYLAFALLFTVLYLGLKGLQEHRWQWWQLAVGRIALAWLVMGLSFSWLVWEIWKTEQAGAVKLEVKPLTVVNDSVAVHSYFTQLDGNVMLGQLLGLARTAAYNRVHYLGFGVLLLVLLALVIQWRRNWLWLVIGLFFAVASFGPTLRTDPQVNPEIGPTLPWLPWNWLQEIPLLNSSHSPTRLALPVLICAAILVAQAVAWLLRRNNRFRGFAGLAIVLVLLVEGPALPGLSRVVEVPPQVSIIENDCARLHCGDAAVLDLPFTLAHYTSDHDLMLYGALREKPIMGGYLSREIPNPYTEPASPFQLFLKPTSQPEDIFRPTLDQSVLRLLNGYNIRYITVDQGEFERTYGLAPEKITAYLSGLLGPQARIYNGNGLEIYRVSGDGSRPTPLLVPEEGWQQLELDKNAPPKRWVNSLASILIYSFDNKPASLSFEAVAFNRVRHVKVSLNNQALGELEIKPDTFGSFRLDGLQLKLGSNLLVLDPVEDPESPAQLDPKSKDTRSLSVGFRQFELKWQN